MQRVDYAALVRIANLEGITELFLLVSCKIVRDHNFEELLEIDFATCICIRILDHVLNFFVSRILANTPEGLSQLVNADRATAVSIEDVKFLLVILDLILG